MTGDMPNAEVVTLQIPYRVVKRGGRKEMVLPGNASEGAPPQRRTDNTLVKALARAFRWRRMLESGEFATVTELANHEEITLSYVTRVLQLTRLAPDLIESILEGRHDRELTTEAFRRTLPDDWADQRRMLKSGD